MDVLSAIGLLTVSVLFALAIAGLRALVLEGWRAYIQVCRLARVCCGKRKWGKWPSRWQMFRFWLLNELGSNYDALTPGVYELPHDVRKPIRMRHLG
jgi:hypothetical protein